MSKINQIQTALRELDGGAFQKLADFYLKKKGYDYLIPLGSVIGKNKVKTGTPDTLVYIPMENMFLQNTQHNKLSFLQNLRVTSINASTRKKLVFP